MAKKVIVTCAVTGASFTPTMSDGLPYKPDDIVNQAVAAHEAGAAVLHIHGRDPDTGEPSADPELFRDYAERIKEQTSNAIISMTTGGATGQPIEDRLRVIKLLQPELCTCNLGTLNYGGFPMIPKYEGKWKFEWERDFLEMTRSEPFMNNFSDIEYMLKELTHETGTRFEFEAYDLGHLYTLAYYLEMGIVKPPIFIQFVMGTFGGLGADMIDNLVYMRQTAERLLGNDLEWSVLGGGRYQLNMVTAGAMMGSHVRVGLEDSLYLEKGKLADNNAQQVEKVKRILGELSLEIATVDEARSMLDLKGIDNTKF